jgi:hypothetical protein
VSVADSLPSIWYTVQTKTDDVKLQTEQLFTAADDALAVLDACAGIGDQYLALKNTVCNTMEDGVAGIAMAAFFIAFCGLASIFVYGAVIMSFKEPDLSANNQLQPDQLSDIHREEEEFLNDGYAPPYEGQEWNELKPINRRSSDV